MPVKNKRNKLLTEITEIKQLTDWLNWLDTKLTEIMCCDKELNCFEVGKCRLYLPSQ